MSRFNFNETKFRRVEPLLARFVASYPTPIEFDTPPDITTQTFSHRIRFAIAVYEVNKWPASFTYEEFAHAWSGSVLTNLPGSNKVRMGPRNATGTAAPVAAHQTSARSLIDCELNTTILLAILLLHDKGAFVLPTHLVLLNDSTELDEICQSHHLTNISYVPHTTGGYVLF